MDPRYGHARVRLKWVNFCSQLSMEFYFILEVPLLRDFRFLIEGEKLLRAGDAAQRVAAD